MKELTDNAILIAVDTQVSEELGWTTGIVLALIKRQCRLANLNGKITDWVVIDACPILSLMTRHIVRTHTRKLAQSGLLEISGGVGKSKLKYRIPTEKNMFDNKSKGTIH